jgi:hypothetical protein
MTPRYMLQIDEEGFPQFDGLRVDDESFVRGLLENLRRREPGVIGSPLVTRCEGEEVGVDAFDAPLVAQSVEDIDDQGSTWVFPGAIRHQVKHADLEVDEWHRLHAWIGAELLPAVLSRKAQAAFLHGAPVATLAPRPFRQPAPDRTVNGVDFWEACYREGRDGWDMRGPNPILLAKKAELRALAGSRLVVPGAGRGHDVAFLESQGAHVTAIDFAEEAGREFHRLYPASRAEFVRDDAFAYLRGAGGSFDSVFEHTIYCAIDPARRREYLEAVHAALRPGGAYFGIFLLRAGPGGPPFGTTQWELRELTRDLFTLEAWELSRDSQAARWGLELWAVLRARAAR